MVKKTPGALKERRSGDVQVETPPTREVADVQIKDFESSYLSICCLVQTDSQASRTLVNESMILSKMFERLLVGVPNDIEELTLGALSGALGWVSSDIVDGLINQGLLDYCHEIVNRFIAKGVQGRVPDRTCETAIEIIRDMVTLNDIVESLVIEKLELYSNLAISCPTVFPAVTIKRSVARLIQTLVELRPKAFVSGLRESRLTPEILQGLFALCGCPDLETSCYMILSSLTLEQVFGSQVVPASQNIPVDILHTIGSILEESLTFVGEPSGEDELRLDQWRSKLRGISSLVDLISENVESLVSDGIEKTDSIEDSKFFTQKSVPENPMVSKLFAFEPLLVVLEKLARLIQNRASEEDQPPTSEPIPYLEDRDLSNVFELISNLFKIRKIFSLRVSSSTDRSVAILAAETLASLVSVANVDLSVASKLIQECLDTLFSLLLSVLARKNSDGTAFMQPENLVEFAKSILVRLIKESIERIDNRHIVFDDEDEEISAVTVACLQLVQLMYLCVGSSVKSVGSVCGASTLMALSTLTESNITASIACWIAETAFIVFGEKYNDELLAATPDWITRMSSLVVYLKPKAQGRSERAGYIQGTVENIQAFLQYKLS